jgi:hypothetical protein
VVASLQVCAHNADDADNAETDPRWLADQVIEIYLDRFLLLSVALIFDP